MFAVVVKFLLEIQVLQVAGVQVSSDQRRPISKVHQDVGGRSDATHLDPNPSPRRCRQLHSGVVDVRVCGVHVSHVDLDVLPADVRETNGELGVRPVARVNVVGVRHRGLAGGWGPGGLHAVGGIKSGLGLLGLVLFNHPRKLWL